MWMAVLGSLMMATVGYAMNANPRVGPAGTTVNLVSQARNLTSGVKWDFGDGTKMEGAGIQDHTWNAPGSFKVIASWIVGTTTHTDTATVTVTGGTPTPTTTAPSTVPGETSTTTTTEEPEPTTSTTVPLAFPLIDPTYCTVTIAIPNQTHFLWWCSGTPAKPECHTADQAERDAMESFMTDVAWPELDRYVRDEPACKSLLWYSGSKLGEITTGLGTGPFYFDLASTSPWYVKDAGRNYGNDWYYADSVRTCVLGGTAAQRCAAKMSLGLREYLNIRVEGGECVAGGITCPLPVKGAIDGPTSKAGVADRKAKIVPPTDSKVLDLLHRTHVAHKAVSDVRCGLPGDVTAPSVKAAHQAYESSPYCQQNATYRHFCRMKIFSGYADTVENGNPNGWTREEECKWARKQDEAHMQWMQGEEQGNWVIAWRADSWHRWLHGFMNRKPAPDVIIPVRWACTFDPNVEMGVCPTPTAAEYLASIPTPEMGPN
jgi:PKD repeat protein